MLHLKCMDLMCAKKISNHISGGAYNFHFPSTEISDGILIQDMDLVTPHNLLYEDLMKALAEKLDDALRLCQTHLDAIQSEISDEFKDMDLFIRLYEEAKDLWKALSKVAENSIQDKYGFINIWKEIILSWLHSIIWVWVPIIWIPWESLLSSFFNMLLFQSFILSLCGSLARLVQALSLLMLLSGDVELNPGPPGECDTTYSILHMHA